MPRKIDPTTLNIGAGTLPAGTVDDNAFKYPERDVDPLRVHIHDPSRAHMASAIGIVDAADCYISDEVEGALQELCGGMSAGRMNGMVEGGYIVDPPDSAGHPPYPAPAAGAGLKVTLVAPGTGNPSTVLIGAHVVDISGFEYDFAIGVDPVGGASTGIAGIYYLYVETDHTSADYQKLVASTTLPVVALEKILIAMIVHDGTNILKVVDTRYFVANLDRKLPYTLRSGIPINTGDGTFGGEDTDTWSEALFQTLDAALFWIANYDGSGDTQEEKATIIVRGRQVLSESSYLIPDGVTLQGSGPDAKIIWQGSGVLFKITGADVRFKDLQILLDNDINVTTVAIDLLAPAANAFKMENCTISNEAGSLIFTQCIAAQNNNGHAFTDCFFVGGRGGNFIAQFHNCTVTTINHCVFNGNDEASAGVRFDGNTVTDVTVKDCNILKGDPSNSWGLLFVATVNSHGVLVEGNDIGSFPNGIFSNCDHTMITNNNIEVGANPGVNTLGIHFKDGSPAAKSDCTIVGNWVYSDQTTDAYPVDSEPTGILLEGDVSAVVSNNHVLGNWFNDNAGNTGGAVFGSGIASVDDGTAKVPTPVVIDGNEIENGVIIEQAKILTFTGNTVTSTLITGSSSNPNENLRIGAGSQQVAITGNVFYGRGVAMAAVAVYGDESAGTISDEIQVTGNTCRDHRDYGFYFVGAMSNCSINDNILLTPQSDAPPAAEAIVLEGVSGVGVPREMVVSGNNIQRFIRGIAAVGYSDNATTTYITNVNVSGNTITEIGSHSVQSPWNQQSYDTVNQGIVFAYAKHCSAVGNQLLTIGVTFDLSGNPIVLGDKDYYGVGIHVWRSTHITVNDNTIHDLFSHKASAGSDQPFCVGIYYCLTPNLTNAVTTAFDQYNCIGNSVFSPQVIPMGVNRNNTIAGILVYANQDDEPTAFFTMDNFRISGNNIQEASHWVNPTELPSFLGMGSNQTIGGCGILCWFETSSATAAWPSIASQVSITDNAIEQYGQKAIAVRVVGYDAVTPQSYVMAKSFKVSGNQANISSDGPLIMSYVDEESINMDGGVVILQGQSSSMWDLTIDNNTLFSSIQTGIMVGTTGGNASGDSSVYNASISNNKVLVLNTDKALTNDTYCVCVRALGPDDNIHKCLFKGIAVNGNKLGTDGGVADDEITEWWGVWFGVSTSAGAPGNRKSTSLQRVQIHDNNIYTAMAEIAIDQVGDANTALKALEDISIQGNQGYRCQEQYAGSEHPALMFDHLGFRTAHSQARNIEISNNSFVSSSAVAPVGGSTYGLAGFRWAANNPTLAGGGIEEVRILGNRFDGALGDPTSSQYVYAAMQFVFNSLEHSDGFTIANNAIHGPLFITTVNPSLVFCRKWTIDSNRWSGKGQYAFGIYAEAGAGTLDHNDGSGMRDWVVTNNQSEAYNAPSLANTAFQMNMGVDNTNMANVRFSGNVVDNLHANGAGGLLVAGETSFIDGVAVTDNTFSGGGRPHIWYKGQDGTAGTNIRIEGNACEWLTFVDGGWNAAGGHPDSVILYEGASVNNDTEGDEMISISRNIIRNCVSTLPDITDTAQAGLDKLYRPNGAIYFGPAPDIQFNNGASPTDAWQRTANIFIDENSIQSCTMGTGIIFNAFSVRYNVSTVSVSRNRIGSPTKNLTEGVNWRTPIVGIEFLGKYMYDAGGSVGEAGKKGMDLINIDENQVELWNGDSGAAGDYSRRGIIAKWQSEWDNSSGPVATDYATFAYNASNISVSRNKVTINLVYSPGSIRGIEVGATSDVCNLQVDGNTVNVPPPAGGETWTMTKGIYLRHWFQGSASAGSECGIRVQALAGGVQQTVYDLENGVWLTGATSSLNPDLLSVQDSTDQVRNVKLVKWDNISLSDNQVYGACKIDMSTLSGNPIYAGAIVFAPVAYYGLVIPGSGGSRSLTMIPVYNFRMTGNDCKNPQLYDPETLPVTFDYWGFRIMYTGLNRNVGTLDEAQSGLYRGWRLTSNSANWYCVSNAANSGGILEGNSAGYDVIYNTGGYVSTMNGWCQDNYCAQLITDGGSPYDRVDGWSYPFTLNENINEIPWLVT
jgi:hypothetical protein